MVVLGRLHWILKRASEGHDVHFSSHVSGDRRKFKFCVGATAGVVAEAQRSVSIGMINVAVQSCTDPYVVSVDHGHRHSNGCSVVTVFVCKADQSSGGRKSQATIDRSSKRAKLEPICNDSTIPRSATLDAFAQTDATVPCSGDDNLVYPEDPELAIKFLAGELDLKCKPTQLSDIVCPFLRTY
jgi:hypothetical protein